MLECILHVNLVQIVNASPEASEFLLEVLGQTSIKSLDFLETSSRLNDTRDSILQAVLILETKL